MLRRVSLFVALAVAAFVAAPGAVADAQSPALRGADNRQFPGTYHNDLREDPDIVAVYPHFLEVTEARRRWG